MSRSEKNGAFLKDFGGIPLVLRVCDSVSQFVDQEGRWDRRSDVMRIYSEAPNASVGKSSVRG